MGIVNQETPDQDLVEAARMGSHRAFERLVKRHFPMVFAIAYANLGHAETAEDMTQEVFLRSYLFLGNLGRTDRFAGWLCRITRNLAHDWQRRKQRSSRLMTLVPLGDVPMDLPDADQKGVREMMEEDEERKALHESIMKLPPPQREVVLLHFMEDMSKSEIAQRLDVHCSTVSRQIDSALKTIRKSLEPALRDTLRPLRRKPQALARALTSVAAVSVLSAQAKTSLAASAGGKAWAVSTAIPPAIPTGLWSLLKAFISSTIAKGGAAMMTGKGVGIAVTAGSLAIGGAIYHAKGQEGKTMTQQPDQSKSQTITSGKITPEEEKCVRAYKECFPPEVVKKLREFADAKSPEINPGGTMKTKLSAITADKELGVWLIGFQRIAATRESLQDGKIRLLRNGSIRPTAILDESGKVYPCHYENSADNQDQLGRYTLYMTPDKAWQEGQEKTITHIFGSNKLPERPDGKYWWSFGNSGFDGIWQMAFVLPKRFELVSSSQQPVSRVTVAGHDVIFWHKRTDQAELYKVDVVMQKASN